MDLKTFNLLPVEEAKAGLLECCHCDKWVDAVVSLRPFESLEHLRRSARELWFALDEAERLNTFNSKPRIGELAQLRAMLSLGPRWDEEEQAGVDGMVEELRKSLDEGNEAYEAKFGFRFIIFATGKSDVEMITAINTRINNDRDTEIRIATEENHKITELRIFKKWLVASSS